MSTMISALVSMMQAVVVHYAIEWIDSLIKWLRENM